ncbi:XRE family transcriptional regulator [bacterium]|nr:XRE family transcriptional regulator [bacterium]
MNTGEKEVYMDKKELRNKVANILRQKRQDMGLSGVELIKKVHKEYDYYIDKSYLSRWENGTNSPPIEAMKIFCNLYGLKLSDLYEVDEGIQKEQAPFSIEKLELALKKFNMSVEDLNKLSEEKLSLIASVIKTLYDNDRKG